MTDSPIVPLITGAGGRLGRALTDLVEERHPASVSATRDELDVTDYFRLVSELQRLEPSVVVNLASFTHVDGCEDDPARSERVNVNGARQVARAAAQTGAWLIHVSTDLVFDGDTARPYIEEDEPSPLSVYGRHKLEGEIAVREEAPDALILRASWFFGEGAGKFPENFLALIEKGQPVGLVSDRYGTATYIPDLAEAIARLLPLRRPGVLHFTNLGGMTTRYDFIRTAARMLGLDESLVRPLSHTEWKGDRAPRPLNSALDPSEFIRVTGWSPPTWEASLGAYVRGRG